MDGSKGFLSIFPAPTQSKDIHLLGREFLQRESRVSVA